MTFIARSTATNFGAPRSGGEATFVCPHCSANLVLEVDVQTQAREWQVGWVDFPYGGAGAVFVAGQEVARVEHRCDDSDA